jgi:hypothetical protein
MHRPLEPWASVGALNFAPSVRQAYSQAGLNCSAFVIFKLSVHAAPSCPLAKDWPRCVPNVFEVAPSSSPLAEWVA